MPIHPVTKTILLPVESPEDVAELFDATVAVSRETSDSRRRALSRDLGDHWAFLAGTHPEWFRPFQERLAGLADEQLESFELTFADLAVLMNGASNACVESLIDHLQRAPNNLVREWILAGIGSEHALEAVATYARAHGAVSSLADSGVAIQHAGPARWRFSPNRLAVFTNSGTHPQETRHPIGLPLRDCLSVPERSPVTWHYLSVDTDELSSIISWPARHLHLVSPRVQCEWTLFADVADDGRYSSEQVVREDNDDELADLLVETEHAAEGRGYASLRAYDEKLIYCNSHIMCTDHVVGTAGGPPIGLYPNPSCPQCGLLMFHVLSVEHHVREYGDGFRSLFVCEACQQAACRGTSWN